MAGLIMLKSWHEVFSLDFSDPATAQRLWNCDKTGLCTAAGAKSLLVK